MSLSVLEIQKSFSFEQAAKEAQEAAKGGKTEPVNGKVRELFGHSVGKFCRNPCSMDFGINEWLSFGRQKKPSKSMPLKSELPSKKPVSQENVPSEPMPQRHPNRKSRYSFDDVLINFHF